MTKLLSKFILGFGSLLIVLSSAVIINSQHLYAAAPDCSTIVFGRCLNTGYLTGSTDTDDATLPLLYPIEPTYSYSESCHALPIPITQWSFPSVACNSRNNSVYTTQFINQIKDYLDNFCNTEFIPLSTTSSCGLRRRNALAAAQIVNTMLGKNGPSYGTYEWNVLCAGGGQWYLDCYNKAMVAGVNDARASFASWSYIVTRYDQLGRINWNGIEAYAVGDINSGGINYGTDVDLHRISHTGWSNRIIFEDAAGNRIYGINRNCGNLVGNLKKLDPPPDATSTTTPNPSALFNGDDEDPSKVLLNASATQTSPNYSVVVSRSIYVIRAGTLVKVPVSGYPDETWSGSGSHSFATVEINSPTLAPLNLTPGDRICVSVTVDRPSVRILPDGTIVDEPGGVSSLESCKRLVNKPYLSFQNGDVATGGVFEDLTGCPPAIPATSSPIVGAVSATSGLGSSVEFAAFVFDVGTISGFNTADSHGTPASLAFANHPSGTRGQFGAVHCIPNYFVGATPPVGAVPTAIDLATRGAGEQVINTNSVTLGGTLPNSARITLYVHGDLTVTNNIDYVSGLSTTWANTSEIPSLHVYVNGNIYIQKNVTNMIGFFTAQENGTPGTGKIFTCTNGATPVAPSSALFDECGGRPGVSGRLYVRGALAANKIEWMRTARSLRNATGGVEANAAEVVDLAPELLMVAPEQVATPGGTPPEKYKFFTTLPPVL